MLYVMLRVNVIDVVLDDKYKQRIFLTLGNFVCRVCSAKKKQIKTTTKPSPNIFWTNKSNMNRRADVNTQDQLG